MSGSSSMTLTPNLHQALQQSQNSLRSLRKTLEQREQDLNAVQAALQGLESEKRKLGESATTDRFSLELEVDRLKRDLARCQTELDLATEDVKDKERRRRESEAALDKLVSSTKQMILVISHIDSHSSTRNIGNSQINCRARLKLV